VPAVVRDPGDEAGDLADQEIATAARVAVTAVPTVPADANPVAEAPAGDAGTEGVNGPGHLVSGDTGILNAGPVALLGQGIAVADAGGLHADAHLARTGLGYLALHDLVGAFGAHDLGRTHPGHRPSYEVP
jgi:hypothetical protein